MNLKEYTTLKVDVDRLAERAAKAEGALEREIARLKEIAGTPEQAKSLLVDLGIQLKEAEAEATEKLRAFNLKWGDKIR